MRARIAPTTLASPSRLPPAARVGGSPPLTPNPRWTESPLLFQYQRSCSREQSATSRAGRRDGPLPRHLASRRGTTRHDPSHPRATRERRDPVRPQRWWEARGHVRAPVHYRSGWHYMSVLSPRSVGPPRVASHLGSADVVSLDICHCVAVAVCVVARMSSWRSSRPRPRLRRPGVDHVDERTGMNR